RGSHGHARTAPGGPGHPGTGGCALGATEFRGVQYQPLSGLFREGGLRRLPSRWASGFCGGHAPPAGVSDQLVSGRGRAWHEGLLDRRRSMVTTHAPDGGYCRPATRREFLGAGLAGTLGLAVSPLVQQLLAGEPAGRRAKACILLWLNG